MANMTVLFLGPCRKFDAATAKPFPAFSPASRSGRFLRSAIQAAAVPNDIELRFDNIIPRPVYDRTGKERNPSCAELVSQLDGHVLWELRDGDVVVGLSAAVGEALLRVRASRIASGDGCRPTVLKLEHPSYMMRRPIEERTDYAQRLGACIRLAMASFRRAEIASRSPFKGRSGFGSKDAMHRRTTRERAVAPATSN
jgi:hypothetical protein